jgi:fibronectin-binding autotransporter adhesin
MNRFKFLSPLRRGLTAASVLVALRVAGPVSAGDRYVAPNGVAPNDGSKWSLAFTNIQDALNVAAPGETIYLAGQTFFLTNQIIWTGTTHVTIRGGYAATNDTDQPGPYSAVAWPTVITRAAAYSNRIMIVTNVATGTLECVTITGGYQTNANTYGGGLHIVGSPGMVISACVISNNAVAATGDGGGGGLYIKSSAVTVSNCWVAGNSVAGSSNSYGGGIWMEGPVTVVDSVIANNRCTGVSRTGGGLYAYQGTCLMRNCLVAGNTTFGGTGDGFRGDYGGNTLDQCTVANNTGMGISGRPNVQITVTNSIVWGNGTDVDSGWNQQILADSVIGNGGTGPGCLSVDPLFDRLYYLAPGSPCLDAGTNTANDRGLSGYTTRVDGTTDSGRVDLGYHYPTGFDLTGLDLFVATNGDDSAVGTDVAHPFRTLTKALARARNGTRIHVGSGSYTNGSERFPLTVANLTGLQILGTNHATTIINAAGSGNRVLTLTNSSAVALTEVMLTGGQTNTGSGGGMALWACGGIVLSGCVISNNTGIGYGGGIYSIYSFVTLSNCLVKGNTAAPLASGLGGGIYLDIGGMMTLRDSILANNQSYSGGGIYNYSGTCWLKNCLVVENTSAGGGAGINCAYGYNTLQNCTVAHNTGSGIYGPSGAAPVVTNSIVFGNTDDFSGPTILNNLVWSDIGDGDNNGTNGCISADPQFRYGNYYLDDNSLCVDAGIDTASACGLAGYTTRVDGTTDSGRVDLGYHYTTGLPDLRECSFRLASSATMRWR